jgi:hypothetical protein
VEAWKRGKRGKQTGSLIRVKLVDRKNERQRGQGSISSAGSFRALYQFSIAAN